MVIFFIMVMSRIDTLSFGGFVALNAAIAQFNAAFAAMFGAMGQILKIVPLYERVKPILQTAPEVDHTGLEPGTLDGEIGIRNVSFYYSPGDPFVFADLNLSIKQGQFVALVGPSGAGKSTLFRLLLGFEAPQEGKVLYDGKNLATLNIQKIRQQLGVVLQTSTLMPGTIWLIQEMQVMTLDSFSEEPYSKQLTLVQFQHIIILSLGELARIGILEVIGIAGLTVGLMTSVGLWESLSM